MERNAVFNALFNTIRDSLDWAYEVENKEYASYVNGVITLGDKLLSQLDKNDQSKEGWTWWEKHKDLESLSKS